jgi:predicted DNA-binding transcriptional regulator AlpA
MNELLTIEQVSEMTTLSVPTLRWYRATGKGPKSGKVGGRAVRYRRSDVEAWINEGFA